MSIEAAKLGVRTVLNPQGRIERPISNDPNFEAIQDKLGSIFLTFQKQYKSAPQGILFRYPEIDFTAAAISASFNSAVKMGDASTGLCPFGLSAILSQLALEDPDHIAMLKDDQDWTIDNSRKTAFARPLLVNTKPDNLSYFANNLNRLFSEIAENPTAPRVTYIPCRLDNNDRSHWVIIAVEKHNDGITATYINTRGGDHEEIEPPERTLKAQEQVIQQAALQQFGTALCRNPSTPICLTSRSCGFDIVNIAERLTKQVNEGHRIAEFVQQGGLLQQSDLALTHPAQADLANRARCSEKFIGFLHSWNC